MNNDYYFKFLVVSQEYSTKAEDEYVIVGNDVLMKCKVPSFVSDQVTVINWIDNEGETLYSGSEYSKPHFVLKKKSWDTLEILLKII